MCRFVATALPQKYFPLACEPYANAYRNNIRHTTEQYTPHNAKCIYPARCAFGCVHCSAPLAKQSLHAAMNVPEQRSHYFPLRRKPARMKPASRGRQERWAKETLQLARNQPASDLLMYVVGKNVMNVPPPSQGRRRRGQIRNCHGCRRRTSYVRACGQCVF